MKGELGARISAAVREATAAGNGLAVAAALDCRRAGRAGGVLPRKPCRGRRQAVGRGLPASPGAAGGRIVLDADEAVAAADAGEAVILVRPETTPDDVLGMQASQGILTTRGGMVSHAAVVARGWGIPAVVGAADVDIDGDTGDDRRRSSCKAGDEITIDGSTGRIFAGLLAMSSSEPPPELDTCWPGPTPSPTGTCRSASTPTPRATPATAVHSGAQGIGLCRTEHMFLSQDRLPIMRRFILAADPDAEAAALAELEVAQTHDFERLLDAMDACPVTVRLLDPPLHEFLPDLIDLTARQPTASSPPRRAQSWSAVRRLHETNPMIGTRGVRLGVVRPGVYEMQVRALCTAAASLFERGKHPNVEIMIPLVVDAEELRIARSWVREVLDRSGTLS